MKRILIALAKAGAYALLFIGMQLVVTFAASLIVGIELGMQLVFDNTTPDIAAIAEQIAPRIAGQTMLITLISSALTLLLLWLVFTLRHKRFFTEISLVKPPRGSILPCVLLGAVLAATLGIVLSHLPIPESVWTEYAEASADLGTQSGVIGALASILLAPIAEEVIFRGLVYTRLRRVMPVWVALLLESAVFGLLHGQLIWVCYAFVLGAAFTLVFEWTGSLLSCIVLHMAFNLMGSYGLPYVPVSYVSLCLFLVDIVLCWFLISYRCSARRARLRGRRNGGTGDGGTGDVPPAGHF